jgi:hypothetical protein
VLRPEKDLCRLPCTGALYMSWYCVLCCAHVMVLCFVLCTRHCPCHSCVRCVLVQGMVLHDQIESPWISLTSFLHVIRASRKSYENHGVAPGHLVNRESIHSFDFDFPHHLGITKIHMKITGQHLVIISRSAALRDTLTLEEDPGLCCAKHAHVSRT